MRNIVLTVTFDIDQDSQLPQWAFTADGKPISGQGVETGLLAFQMDDQVSVIVAAQSEKSPSDSVHIDGCHFITIPRAFTKRENPERAGEFPEASPFNEYGAVIDLGSGECESNGQPSTKQWQSKTALKCDNIGRWELSFVITTTITRPQGDLLAREQRVFAFDPEVEVGNGT